MLVDVEPITPFSYQAKSIAKAIGQFEKGIKSTVLVMATGTGKTITGGYLARWGIEEKEGRVLWIAHRDLLITQAVDDLALCGVEAVIEKADQYARGQSLYGEPSCVVASVQTMKGNRLLSWPTDYFELIIVDEAHHATSGSYRRIFDHFAWSWMLGLTATPDRADGECIGQVFQSIADEFSLRDAVDGGWLARPRVVRCETDIDLASLSTRGKDDFSDDDLEAVMKPHIADLANSIKQEVGDRSTFIFTPGVKSAEGMASALASIGVPCHSISGDTRNRDEIWDDFRSRRVQAVANCLDDQTEILTSRGWMDFADFRETDLTASLNLSTGAVEWVPISRLTARQRHADERMVHVKNQTLDIRVTEGHRMVARTRGAKEWRIVEAGSLASRVCCYELPMAAVDDPFEPVVPEDTKAPRELTDDECRFIGLWIADGTIDRSGGCRGVEFSQSTVYPEANIEIARILDSCGFDWKSSTYSRTPLSSNPVIRYRVPAGNCGGKLKRNGFHHLRTYLDKDFSPLLFGLNRDQTRCLIEGFWLGDGIKFKKRRPRNGIRTGWAVCNSNKTLLDRFQWLAVTRGFAANISPPRDNGPLATKPMYIIGFRDRKTVHTNNVSVPTSGGNPAKLETIWQREMVWCVTNRNGTIFTRRNGKVAIIGQCSIATEGANFPFVAAVALCRPTKSRALYSQMVGRGTRKYPGKDDCLIVDFAFLTGQHKLVQPTELFDTTGTSKEVLDIAREVIDKGETDDLMDAIAKAEKLHKDRAKLRIEVAERRVRYRRVSYDPLSVMDVLAIPVREEAAWLAAVPATHKQLALLQKLGVQGAERLSKTRASKVLDGLMSRMDAGLATHKQIAHLIANGIDADTARSMSRKDASKQLDAIFGKSRSA